jgi:hypothetical protein
MPNTFWYQTTLASTSLTVNATWWKDGFVTVVMDGSFSVGTSRDPSRRLAGVCSGG